MTEVQREHRGLTVVPVTDSLRVGQGVVEVSTVVIGAGQAGLAVSRRLTELEVEHVVLEQARVGQA
jgi:ribulose 1,5-bisphosphate synthetase/thiazole synthase